MQAIVLQKDNAENEQRVTIAEETKDEILESKQQPGTTLTIKLRTQVSDVEIANDFDEYFYARFLKSCDDDVVQSEVKVRDFFAWYKQ